MGAMCSDTQHSVQHDLQLSCFTDNRHQYSEYEPSEQFDYGALAGQQPNQ